MKKVFFLENNTFAYKMDRNVSIDRAIDLKIAGALSWQNDIYYE